MFPRLSKMSREPAFLFAHGKERGLRCRKVAETALTGEGILLLVIATAIVLVFVWLVWRYTKSTQEDARSYAERTMQRLLYEHDAKYFATNLGPKGLPGYPLNHQKYAIASLTKLGVPTAPVKLTGSVSYGSDPGAHDPRARFTSHVVYPAADARFYLDIARRNGLWQIDLFSFGWQDKPSSRPAPSL
jgi:hypothetical protein